MRYLNTNSRALIRCRFDDEKDESDIVLWLGLYIVMARILEAEGMSYESAMVQAARRLGGIGHKSSWIGSKSCKDTMR